MSRNIKEIGKELMGKSLNSFHRKTGLTQLEENNKMQDGILDGILSQVDDAYIEKTEQSNVIHLDGSGDGVVVVDSIEGNTMVNMVKSYDSSNFLYDESQKLDNQYFKLQHSANENSSSVRVKYGNHIYKPNTTYTLVVDIKENTANARLGVSGINSVITKFSSVNFSNLLGQSMITFVTKDDFSTDARGENPPTLDLYFCSWDKGGDLSKHITFRYWILEGDWTDKEIPPYFEGLQSSFEEKVNSEGKHEIEILSNNKNLFDVTKTIYGKYVDHNLSDGTFGIVTNSQYKITDFIKVESGKTYFNNVGSGAFYTKDKKVIKTSVAYENIFTVPSNAYYVVLTSGINTDWSKGIIQLNSINDKSYIPHKSNKIKLLLDEPLRAVGDITDKLVFKDNKLMVERNCKEIILDGNSNAWSRGNGGEFGAYIIKDVRDGALCDNVKVLCNLYPTGRVADESKGKNQIIIYNHGGTLKGQVRIIDSSCSNVSEFKTKLLNNLTKIVYEINPVYEEVLNEYGEPIVLEGYENGTIYIDSTIVPTTTVRYTPKMDSFRTLKEVNNNNIMLTNDVNDNIIPYMMDVDLMIMEKEMALPSKVNIRRIGAKDMTSMQKRTQDMLERLIKGKTLTEQECKTRVAVYLNAGKITDEQAKELNFLIDEIYA